MTQYVIKQARTGNCNCMNCNKDSKRKMLPYTVYAKRETEKRGHNNPVCSRECAMELIEKMKAIDAVNGWEV